MRSADAFQLTITPSRDLPIIASSEDSTMEARKDEASVARLLSVISITEPARPMNSPSSVKRGALTLGIRKPHHHRCGVGHRAKASFSFTQRLLCQRSLCDVTKHKQCTNAL